MSLRGLLRNFGLKVGAISRGQFEHRIRELAVGNLALLWQILVIERRDRIHKSVFQ
jgi:hypothetical protein